MAANVLQSLPWVTIFGLMGNIISSMVFLSPIPTFYQVFKKKSTEGFQSIPYVVALFSSMLWLFYAYFAPDSTLLVTINSFGLFIETIYISMFLFYGTKQARLLTIKLIGLMNVAGFGFILFITLVFLKTTALRIKVLGWINLIFALCVFVAPLGVLRQVIRTKSVKYMPFLLSFFLTISAVMWFFYGLLKHDYYVAIPNVLGFTFGILQMILYAIYRNSKTVEKDIENQKITEMSTNKVIQVVKLNSNSQDVSDSDHQNSVQSPSQFNTAPPPSTAAGGGIGTTSPNIYAIHVDQDHQPRGPIFDINRNNNNITVGVAA